MGAESGGVSKLSGTISCAAHLTTTNIEITSQRLWSGTIGYLSLLPGLLQGFNHRFTQQTLEGIKPGGSMVQLA